MDGGWYIQEALQSGENILNLDCDKGCPVVMPSTERAIDTS